MVLFMCNRICRECLFCTQIHARCKQGIVAAGTGSTFDRLRDHPIEPFGSLRDRTRRSDRVSKLFQEAKIVFTEEADIADTILQQSRTFDAHTECKAGVFIGVDVAVL